MSQFHTGQCGDCLVDGFECVLFVWGEACPPCASSCGECTFTNQFLFLETLSLYRDTQCALLSITKTDPLYCADRPRFSGSLREREEFLFQFYADVKQAFVAFDFYTERSASVVARGYTLLLRRVSDPSILNLITILAAALEVSPGIEKLLCHRLQELGLDFDGLFAKAQERVAAVRARQSRRSFPHVSKSP